MAPDRLQPPVQERMICWLAQAARQLRLEHGGNITRIAARHDVRDATITRFEKRQSKPEELDALVAAYAAETGVPAIDYWRHALRLWEQAAAADG